MAKINSLQALSFRLGGELLPLLFCVGERPRQFLSIFLATDGRLSSCAISQWGKRGLEIFHNPLNASRRMTDRLLRLEEFGLIEKSAYEKHPIRYDYAVTQKGAELLPVLQAVCKWANKHLPGTWKTPDRFLSLKPSDLTVKKTKTGE